MGTLKERFTKARKESGKLPAVLARECGVTRSAVYQIEDGTTKSLKGVNLVRFATALSVEPLWLGEGRGPKKPGTRSTDIVSLESDRHGEIVVIPKTEAWASMGSGAPTSDHLDIVDSVRVRLAELRRQATFTAPQNLRVLSAYGDSMEPTFKDGDVLIIDIGVTELKVDAIYVLERDKELFVKRITRHPVRRGVFVMSSDNKDHPSFEIETQKHDFTIHGRVVLAWNSKRL